MEEKQEKAGVVNVWSDNMHEEIQKIIHLVDEYPFVAMDTEFPGVVVRPVGSFKSSSDYHYQTLKCNVDMLKLIQLGLSFFNKNGERPPGTCTWQFNFQFDISQDPYAQDSIELLQEAGLDFKGHQTRGIDPALFAEQLISSGLVLNDEITWITFHAGYDVGYLVRLCTGQELPGEEPNFFDLLDIFFPCLYDLKHLMKSCENLKGGLEQLAEDLQVKRIGPQHQGGSDSMLTGVSFFKMRSLYFENSIDREKFRNVVFGLGERRNNSAYRSKQ